MWASISANDITINKYFKTCFTWNRSTILGYAWNLKRPQKDPWIAYDSSNYLVTQCFQSLSWNADISNGSTPENPAGKASDQWLARLWNYQLLMTWRKSFNSSERGRLTASPWPRGGWQKRWRTVVVVATRSICHYMYIIDSDTWVTFAELFHLLTSRFRTWRSDDDDRGQTACIPCHASRTTSVKGASSLADCICPGGTIEDSNAKCVECSIGLTCPVGPKYHSSCSDASGIEHWNQLALDCMLYRDSSMAIASEVSHYLKSYHGEEQNAG